MDTDERNQKLSRLVKETEECCRAIAAPEQKLQGFYEILTEIAFQLNAVYGLQSQIRRVACKRRFLPPPGYLNADLSSQS